MIRSKMPHDKVKNATDTARTRPRKSSKAHHFLLNLLWPVHWLVICHRRLALEDVMGCLYFLDIYII